MEPWILRVLQLSALHEMPELMWTVNDGEVKFFISCSDVFWWGTADAEPLTAQTLHLLEQALADVHRVDRHGSDGPLLYCARRRAMRPQGAMYKHLDPATWPLFDACGPERLPDLGNPMSHPPVEQPPALR